MNSTMTMAVSAATPDSPENVFTFWPRHQAALYARLDSKHTWIDANPDPADAPLGGDGAGRDPLDHQMTLNIGPQHPATHGVLRAVVKLDGERIEKCVLDIGYLHRGIEKVAENKTFQEFMPYTDRMDYLSPYSNNVAWCLAVEKLCAIEVPERAQWIRTMMSELARVSSHLLWMGVGLMDAGAVSVFLWAWQYREDIYAIFDEVAGARLTVSHSRIGGVASDLTPAAIARLRTFVNDMPAVVEGWRKLLNRNRIWFDRNVGVGVLTADEALAAGLRGPNLRGSGIEHDIRRFEPYLKYAELDFNIPIRTEGDAWARFHVRMEEMLESIKIIRQCLDRLPDGPIRNDNSRKAVPTKDDVYYSMEGMIHDFMMTSEGVVAPKGAHAYHAIEAPKGELGFYLIADGTGSPWRCRINAPSFANLQGLETMMDGSSMGDMVILIGTVDPVLGESDK